MNGYNAKSNVIRFQLVGTEMSEKYLELLLHISLCALSYSLFADVVK